MQTFLPYPDFVASAAVLDERRMGKQRVEALQVFRALTRTPYGWKNHPAVRMWAGHEEALVRYGLDVCAVWRERGRNDTVLDTLGADAREALGLEVVRTQEELVAAGDVPPWIGDERVHVSHRSRLIQKDPDFYRPLFPGTPEDLECFWPVSRAS
ncbi:MAG TPA: MSMEG_6728 family protein [Mycobacteriales bacterium]|nr:MSMEG_6728 family protein [Mycobacteriales bacterium]